MKRLFVLAGVMGALLSSCARTQAQDDQYVRIYNLIQEADTLNSSSQTIQALAKYVEAQKTLERFQKTYPTWNSRVVRFRLNYVASRIAEMSRTVTVVPPATAATSATNVLAAGALPPGDRTELENQVSMLQNQVRQLQADKMLLEAKLKEALSAQPAALDPHELARAEARINTLEKLNGLLQVSLAQAQARAAPGVDAATLERLRRDLAEQTEAAAKLSEERDRLQARVKTLQADAEAILMLRAENEILKKQLADLKSPVDAGLSATDVNRQLAEARAQIAALQSDREIARLEKADLQNQVAQLSAPPGPTKAVPSAGAPPDTARIKQLERERAELERKLDAAQKELYGRKRKSAAARIEELTAQLQALRARLAVYEAQQVPYTEEELVLFKQGEATPAAANPRTSQISARGLPAGTATLVAEARRDFASREFGKAEAKYLQVLQKDKNNVYTLANLATIQLELGHLDDAQKHIQQALALSPEDAYSLLIQGEIKFRQGEYNDALSALSRAATLDPQNAEIQNYLGLTLSQQGMRHPAETAFRKAIQLDPKYAGAHYNLAVFYISQKPPWTELARWHYKKALDAGFPRNADVEKMFDQAKAGAAGR